MKYLRCCLFLVTFSSAEAQLWPHTLDSKNGGKISVYQPQPEKLEGNIVSGRTAISVKQKTRR